MKRIVLIFALINLFHVAIFAQKKYEMVVVKTDGTEIVINTEDIVRTYFREVSEGGGNNDDNDPSAINRQLVGVWYEYYRNYIHGYCFNADGTGWKGEWETYESEKHRELTWKVEGDRLLTYNVKGGDLMDDKIFSVSSDGKTLTLTEPGTGRVNVFEKQ